MTKKEDEDSGGSSVSSNTSTRRRTTLSQAVQKLDEDIVQAINELMAIQAYKPKIKAQHLNELEKLSRECVQTERRWQDGLRQARMSKDNPLHKQVCKEVFADVATPAIVASRQTQLLIRLHTMEVLATQTEMLEKHKRMEYLKLEDELNTVQQLQCLNSQRQLSDILALETEIQTLQAKLEDCPKRTEDPSTSSLARLRKASEETNTTHDTCSISDQEEEDASSSLSSPTGRKMRLRLWNPFGSSSPLTTSPSV
jgi:hypothetical protein